MHQCASARLWGKPGVWGALTAGIAAGACRLPAPALAAPASPALAGAASPVPAGGTPTLADTGTTEQVRQLVACGGTMDAVGTFTQIKQGSASYARDNAFSCSGAAAKNHLLPALRIKTRGATYSPHRRNKCSRQNAPLADGGSAQVAC